MAIDPKDLAYLAGGRGLPAQTYHVEQFARLREANVTRCESSFHPVNEWSPTDWACAMAGEMGECCNEVQKLKRLTGSLTPASFDAPEYDERLRKIAKELADTITYADLLAARLGIDLWGAIVDKFNEVSDRVGSDIKLDL